jgi:hypothetical protein
VRRQDWTALLAAEWLKLRTVRLPLLLALAAVVLTLVSALQPVIQAGRQGTASIGTAGAMLAVLGSTGRGPLLALVFGVLLVSAEYHHATITPVLLQTPARGRLLAAKAMVGALGGMGLGVLGLGTSLGVGALSGAVRSDLLNGDVVWRVVGLLLAHPAYALIGVGIGALLARSQAVAVLVPLTWLLVGEHLVVSALNRHLLPWSLSGATAALANAGDVADVLPVWGGAAVLFGFAFLITALGALRITRADVT